MPEVTLEQAAMALGVSVDTVRRRIRLGRLSAHRDPSGRSLVTVPAAPALPVEIDRERQQEREQFTALQRDYTHLAELFDELRREQQQLADYNALLREQLTEANDAQRALRTLLANAQEQINRLLPPRVSNDGA